MKTIFHRKFAAAGALVILFALFAAVYAERGRDQGRDIRRVHGRLPGIGASIRKRHAQQTGD